MDDKGAVISREIMITLDALILQNKLIGCIKK